MHRPASVTDASPSDEYEQLGGQFWVIDVIGEWSGIARDLDRLFALCSGCPFVLFSPWWPGTREREQAFRAEFEVARELSLSLWATPAGIGNLPSRVFSLRDSIGGGESGLWLFGSCRSLPNFEATLLEISTALPPACTAVLAKKEIEVAVALDESGMNTLLVHHQSPAAREVASIIHFLNLAD